jgi:hypothetical protein
MTSSRSSRHKYHCPPGGDDTQPHVVHYSDVTRCGDVHNGTDEGEVTRADCWPNEGLRHVVRLRLVATPVQRSTDDRRCTCQTDREDSGRRHCRQEGACPVAADTQWMERFERTM